MLELLDDRMAELTIRDYVCSNCWGHLQKWPEEDRMWLVICHRCGEETKGYVTRYYAEGRRSESFAEKCETRLLLESMGIIHNELSGMTEEELLAELGF